MSEISIEQIARRFVTASGMNPDAPVILGKPQIFATGEGIAFEVNTLNIKPLWKTYEEIAVMAVTIARAEIETKERNLSSALDRAEKADAIMERDGPVIAKIGKLQALG